MKMRMHRWLAVLSGLVIAGGLMTAFLAVSAEDVSLDFNAERVGNQIILSVHVSGMDGDYSEYNEYTNAWNVLEYNVAYDADQLVPVQQVNAYGAPVDYLPGDALYLQNAIIQANLYTNPVLVGGVSESGQYQNGEIMRIAFDIVDGVTAEDIELTVNLRQFAKGVIVDGYVVDPIPLVAPGSYTVTVSDAVMSEATVPTGYTETTTTEPTMTQPTITTGYTGTTSPAYPGPESTGDVELSFTADRPVAAAGDTVQLSLNVDGLDLDAGDVWNVLECNVAYDADEIVPVMQNDGYQMVDHLPGDALYRPNGPTLGVNLNTNPVQVGAISSGAQFRNGEIMRIAFEIADDAQVGDTITLRVNVSQFAKSVVVDGQAQDPVDLIDPGKYYTVSITVGQKAEFIQVTKQPDKTNYQWGDGLDLTGMEITAFYHDGSAETVDASLTMVSGFNCAQSGRQTLTVTYRGKTATFEVYVGPRPSPGDMALSFTPDKAVVQAGDTVQLSVNISGLDGLPLEDYVNIWNVLEYNIEYDANQVVPVTRYDGYQMVDWLPGDAYWPHPPTIQVNLNTNPVLVGALSSSGQFRNGEVMNIAFQIADDVQAGDTITLTVNLTQFVKSVVVDGQVQDPEDLVAPGSYMVELTVGEPQPAVASIAVTKQPDKTGYQQGEELDLTGAELTAFYSDGTMETVAITPDMVSGYDSIKIGPQALTVTYKGKTTTFVITVEELVMPESIVITKSPDKTAYRLGEELDLTGAELTAFYDDGSTETVAITPDMVSGYDRNKIGIQALTVTYKGKTTTFAATVYRPGDVNLDGEVKSEDALITLQAATHKIELNGAAALAANVNEDTEISSSDALQILQYATQKIDRF